MYFFLPQKNLCIQLVFVVWNVMKKVIIKILNFRFHEMLVNNFLHTDKLSIFEGFSVTRRIILTVYIDRLNGRILIPVSKVFLCPNQYLKFSLTWLAPCYKPIYSTNTCDASGSQLSVRKRPVYPQHKQSQPLTERTRHSPDLPINHTTP